MIKKDITIEQSQEENLNTWCYEVGSRFEEIGINAANEFCVYWDNNNNQYIPEVVDLGSGDGTSSKELSALGFYVKAVDINPEKLNKINDLFIETIQDDMKNFLLKQENNSIGNIFTHHSLEHCVDADEIIKLCGEKLKSGGIYYATVPAEDYLHSVHHVVFENAEELLPKGLKAIYLGQRERFGEKEFICVAQRL